MSHVQPKYLELLKNKRMPTIRQVEKKLPIEEEDHKQKVIFPLQKKASFRFLPDETS